MKTNHPDSPLVAKKVCRYVLKRDVLAHVDPDHIETEVTRIIDGDLGSAAKSLSEDRDMMRIAIEDIANATAPSDQFHASGASALAYIKKRALETLAKL